MATPFEAAKAMHDRLDAEVARTSAALQLFPTGPMGLTPDHVKASPEFKAAKLAFDRAFSTFRNFNAYFTVVFADDLRAERRARRDRRFSSVATGK